MKLLISLICLLGTISVYALPTENIELESITVTSEANLIRLKHVQGVGEAPEVQRFEVSDDDGLATLMLVQQAYNYSNELQLKLQKDAKLRYAMDISLNRLKEAYQGALEQENLTEDFKLKVSEVHEKLNSFNPNWNALQVEDKEKLYKIVQIASRLHSYDIMNLEKEESRKSGIVTGDHILSKALNDNLNKTKGRSSAGVYPSPSFYADSDFSSEDGDSVKTIQFGAGN